ncbi:hypothetical protein [Oceaniglobus indicus]|uniref:hypothetical protein n=1 Tax=Oceaniglobus indicus TaxID=2047749 RepID=UPI000C1A0A98|nr:hypothetical protein [Oceaniglobus indicus]
MARHDDWTGELHAALCGRLAPADVAWRATNRTWRIAASSVRLWWPFPAEDSGQVQTGTTPLAFQGLSGFAPVPVSLVILSPPDDPRLHTSVRRHAPLFGETIVVLDAACVTPVAGARVAARPLDGDFAAQRNFANRATRGDWILHLDTDESIAPDMAALLGHLAAAADHAGLRAVGFPRRNIVDGRVSDLFPDVQYRLIRRDVKFQGRVHERPLPCADGQATTVAQFGTLDHHLTRARIAERSRTYDRMGQSAERRGDDAALLRPFAA